jgi:hypothetical protein
MACRCRRSWNRNGRNSTPCPPHPLCGAMHDGGELAREVSIRLAARMPVQQRLAGVDRQCANQTDAIERPQVAGPNLPVRETPLGRGGLPGWVRHRGCHFAHQRERSCVHHIPRPNFTESVALSAAASTRGWRDGDEVVLKQDMELEVLQTKGRLAHDVDRNPFRGTPSLRYLIEGTTTVLQFRAGRTWLIPQRKIRVGLSISSNTSVSEAASWLDRLEDALVLA